MSLRQSIFDATLARFALILTANGYKTQLGAKVKKWKTTPVDESERDCLIVRDTVDSVKPEDPNSGKRTWELTFSVEAVLADVGDLADSHARDAIDDIFAAVKVDPTWGTLARRTEEVSAQIMLDKSGNRIGGVQVIFKVITSRRPWET